MFIYNLLWSESDFDFMYWSWSVSTMWLLVCCRCHSNDESLLQVKNISRVVLNPYGLLICRFRLDKWLFSWNISSHDHHNWIDTFELLGLITWSSQLNWYIRNSLVSAILIKSYHMFTLGNPAPGVVWIWDTTFDFQNEIFLNHRYDPNDSHANLLP